MDASAHFAWPPRRFAIVQLGFLAMAGLIAARLSGQTADDFFITYHYAQNLVLGHGFVFNPSEWVLATTAPGWGLLLAALHWLSGISIPVLGTWTFGVCLAAIAGQLWTTMQRLGRGPESLMAGVLLVTSSFLWTHNGFEYPAALLLLLLAGRWLSTRPALAGLMAGVAVWCRPDMGLVLAVLCLAWTFQRRHDLHEVRRLWGRFVAPAGFVVVAGLGLATWFYGHPLPVTLGAKRAQGTWLLPESTGWGFWSSGYEWLEGAYSGAWTPVVILLGLLGLMRLARHSEPPLQALIASSLVITAAYPLLGVPFYTWYAIPLLIGLLYGYCWLVGEALRWICGRLPAPKFQPRRLMAAALGLLLALFPCYVLRRSWQGYQLFDGFPRYALYRQAGEWLAANTSDDEPFATVEVGTLAFFSRRPVYDLVGLVTPRARPFADRGDLAGAHEANPAPRLITTDRLDALLQPVIESFPEAARMTPEASFQNREGRLRILYSSEPLTP